MSAIDILDAHISWINSLPIPTRGALRQMRQIQEARATVAELIEACQERDEAMAQYDLADEFYGGEVSNHKEMRRARGRMRAASKRYVAALARATGGQS